MRCHCGRPLHYSNPVTGALVSRLVEELGEFVNVTVGKRTWRVQRHYIALHGIHGVDLPNLRFKEIKNKVTA